MRANRQPIAISEIYAEASSLYGRAFIPLASTAAAVALIVNFLLFINPSSLVLNLAWGNLVTLFAAVMVSATLILPLVIEIRATGTTNPATRMRGLRLHGRRVLLATAPLVIANGILVFTYVGILLGVFIAVRFCLLPAAVVVEDQDVTDSLSRSWEITQGLVLRTTVVLLGAIAPFVFATIAIAWLSLPYPVALGATTVAAGLVIPFVLIVLLLLFEDYRSLEPEPVDFRPSTFPPEH